MTGRVSAPDVGGRPDPADARTSAEFVAALRRLKAWSGLGFRRLEQRADALGDALPRSTVTAALSRNSLPREDLVAAFARTCGCDKDEVERWVSARRRIAAGNHGRVAEPTPPSTADGFAAVPAATAPAVVPAQLPPAVAGFVGRTDHLAALDSLLAGAGCDGAPAIAVITGTAGIGKTALAVRWAHLSAGRLPDGTLYVNLRGFDPSGSAMSSSAAVRGFLDALAVSPHHLPATLEGQVGLYRSLLAGRRMLVVLDNAADAAQVRPLLPGSPGCLTLVTSRDPLTSLVASEGAHPLVLHMMSTAEGRELLTRRLGERRVAREPDAVGDLISQCARLPLALAIVAARAATHSDFSLAALTAELYGSDGSPLDAFGGEDPGADVRAVFSWSYHRLSGGAARLFRLLGLHPGPGVGFAAAASLVGIPPAAVRHLLAELTRAHLITEHAPGRYSFHDLLRAYATELAHAVDTDEERRAALHRTLDHYLHTASRAERLLHQQRYPVTPDPPRSGVSPEELAGPEQAMAWFTTEHPVLLACIARAAATGYDRQAWQLGWYAEVFLDRRAHWRDWAATQLTALEAAVRLGDRCAEANVHRSLGRACARLRRVDDAQTHFNRSLDLFAELGDLFGQGQVHTSFAWLSGRLERPQDILRHGYLALDCYRACGHQVGQANSLNTIGWAYANLGDHRQAISHCRRALDLLQQTGTRYGLASTWHSLGYAHFGSGEHGTAVACYQRALEEARVDGNRYQEAETLIRLGDAHQATGRLDAAGMAWRQALAILDQAGARHPDAERVGANLRQVLP